MSEIFGLIGAPGPREFANTVVERGLDRGTFAKIYGDEPLQSDYKNA